MPLPMSKPGDYPPLPRSYKGAYPFRLGTTSFIYPDHYIPNVRMLGPYVDEIELLMFESAWPDSLPSEQDIEALRRLGQEANLTYNVHLPTDVSLTDAAPAAQRHAAETLRAFIQRTAPLSPSSCVLHLPFDDDSREPTAVEKWQKTAHKGMELLLSGGTDPRSIAVETLDYPFEWAEPLIRAFDLSVCMDIGHQILYGFDAQRVFGKFSGRISIMHLHGVRDGHDHIALDRLPEAHMKGVINLLRQFTGVVSLEVFSYKHLVPSLECLEKQWQHHKQEK